MKTKQLVIATLGLFILAAGLLGAGLVSAGIFPTSIERVSEDSNGVQGDSSSGERPTISANGRFVAFVSNATNLVAADTNGWSDVFVHDRQSGETTRVSLDSSGFQANSRAFDSFINADGRFVTFYSNATNLVADDTNGTYDTFVHDRQSGETTLVSVDSSGAQADSYSFPTAINANGRVVVFASDATNLVEGDTNGTLDVFVHDRQTGDTSRVSIDTLGNEANDFSSSGASSADGWFIAFESRATNLVTDDTNGWSDVFVHDRQTGETTRVSVDNSGAETESASYADSNRSSISADGRFVGFTSSAPDLVAGDTNDATDIFVHDRQSGETVLVSEDGSGVQGMDIATTRTSPPMETRLSFTLVPPIW